MKCKRHTVDFSSSIGVCASCLRERLFTLAASVAASETDDNDHRHRHSRVSPPPPPPLFFPRSVSPYVAPRKSNAGGGVSSLASKGLFFATPQVGPTNDQSHGGGTSSSLEKVSDSDRSFQKKQSILSRFSGFFRTRSDDLDSRTKFSSRDSCDVSVFSPPSSSSSSSRSWVSKVLSVRSKKQSAATTCYIEDLIASESEHYRHRQRFCRGMSPAGDATVKEFERESVEESPWRQKRTPAMGTPGRRKTAATTGLGRSVSEMAFCLSPLVRAKPNSSSKWKGKFPPEFGYSGELKSPAKPHISKAASFSANRSKKLVDLGKVDHRR